MREFLVIGALVMGAYLWSGREIARPAGVLVAEDPVQRPVYSSMSRQKHGYQIALLASFLHERLDELSAKLLANFFNYLAEVSIDPTD